jgi:hypothetical protein
MSYPNPIMAHKILTHSGRLLDLLNPDPKDINIEDIAHGLSRQFRFGGALRDYTVAQHSILVAESIRVNWPGETHQGLYDAIRLALLHDAAEAYIRDMPTPAKLLLLDYQALESRLMGIILDKFEVSTTWQAMVSTADAAACGMEARLHQKWDLPASAMDELFPPVLMMTDPVFANTNFGLDEIRDLYITIWNQLDPKTCTLAFLNSEAYHG